jgi:enoyl-[acyl-carrier-protein] reductase (NADH)
LKNAHAGNAQVQAQLFATYRREYENFTHLPGESIYAMFQRFTVIMNNMRANVVVLPYDAHDRAVKPFIIWIVLCGAERSKPS